MCKPGRTDARYVPGWRAYAVWLFVIGLIVAWYASCGTMTFPCSPDPLRARATIYHNLYAHQTEGFLRGSLALSLTPGAALRALPNPYDGVSHWPYHPYDVAYYKGRFYMYHGVAPVITLFLPVRLVCGVYLPENLAAVLIFVGALAAQLWLVWTVLRRWLPGAPGWYYHGAALALGLTLPVPYIMTGAAFYHVAIMSSLCWLSVAAVCVWQALAGGRQWYWWLAACGCVMLCTGSRVHVGGVALALLCVLMARVARLNWRAWLVCAVVCLVGLGALVWYNYLRFGNPLEFGVRYLLGEVEQRVYHVRLIPYNLRLNAWLYGCQPPGIEGRFPYVMAHTPPHVWHEQVQRFVNLPVWHPGARSYLVLESTVGLLWGAPYLVAALGVGLGALLIMRVRRAAYPAVPVLIVAGSAMVAAFVIAIPVCAASATAMRYMMDFGSGIILGAWLLAAWVDQAVLRRVWMQRLWRVVLGVGVGAGVLLQCLLGFRGHWDAFRRYNPWLFRALQAAAPAWSQTAPRQVVSNLYADGRVHTCYEVMTVSNGVLTVQHGRFEEWYPDGTLKQRGRYVDGKPDGRWTWWHANGQRAMEGSFRHGAHHGWWCYWDTNGMLTREIFVLEGTSITDISYE